MLGPRDRLHCGAGFAGAWHGVNPFDQPGVELGKTLTHCAMGS